MDKVLLFNRWDTSHIKVTDMGLQRYISIKPMLLPKTHGRNVKGMFWKSRNHIVERLITKIMVPGHKGKKHKLTSGHCCGNALNKYELVKDCFKIIEDKTKKNPVEVFVKAVENAAPREEVTTIEYGGARYPKSVECAPQRRVDFALRMFVQGAYGKAFKGKKKMQMALADEIIKAYNCEQDSNAIAKKLELERQADASR